MGHSSEMGDLSSRKTDRGTSNSCGNISLPGGPCGGGAQKTVGRTKGRQKPVLVYTPLQKHLICQSTESRTTRTAKSQECLRKRGAGAGYQEKEEGFQHTEINIGQDGRFHHTNRGKKTEKPRETSGEWLSMFSMKRVALLSLKNSRKKHGVSRKSARQQRGLGGVIFGEAGVSHIVASENAVTNELLALRGSRDEGEQRNFGNQQGTGLGGVRGCTDVREGMWRIVSKGKGVNIRGLQGSAKRRHFICRESQWA